MTVDIYPGTRVRNIEPRYPHLEGGTYIGKSGFYHAIHWDCKRDDWNDLHTENEFEVVE